MLNKAFMIGNIYAKREVDVPRGKKMKKKDKLCKYCKHPIKITNPTGKCSHVYYPDHANKNYPKPKDKCKHIKKEDLTYVKDVDGLCWTAFCLDCKELIYCKTGKVKCSWTTDKNLAFKTRTEIDREARDDECVECKDFFYTCKCEGGPYEKPWNILSKTHNIEIFVGGGKYNGVKTDSYVILTDWLDSTDFEVFIEKVKEDVLLDPSLHYTPNFIKRFNEIIDKRTGKCKKCGGENRYQVMDGMDQYSKDCEVCKKDWNITNAIDKWIDERKCMLTPTDRKELFDILKKGTGKMTDYIERINPVRDKKFLIQKTFAKGIINETAGELK